jgi:CheY-like chemotaxis protein
MDSKPHLLIVDDRDDHLSLFKESLEYKGFKAYVANSGSMAINKFTRYKVDGILMDMKMEPLDGIDTISRIRAIDADVPIIGMTAFDFGDYQPRALRSQLNVADWVHKPITPKKIDLISEFFTTMLQKRSIKKPEKSSPLVNTKKKPALEKELPFDKLQDVISNANTKSMQLILDVFFELKADPSLATLIRDVFGREVVGIRECINSLQQMEFVDDANKYHELALKYARAGKKGVAHEC